MPVLSYTYESLQLLFEELGLALSKPISHLLAWLSVGEDTGASIPSGGKPTQR